MKLLKHTVMSAIQHKLRQLPVLAWTCLLFGCASVPSKARAPGFTDITLPDPTTVEGNGSRGGVRIVEGASRGQFTAAQLSLITAALVRADSVTADSQFQSTLLQMATEGELQWTEKNFRLIPDSVRSSATQWILHRFSAEGNYRLLDVFAKRKRSSTTAWTTACIPYNPECSLQTALNTRYVYVAPDRTIYAITNTLVHERVHSFGQEHGESQYRWDNVCDAAYILGDLAEAILRRRAEGTPIEPRERLCPALETRLRTLGIVR